MNVNIYSESESYARPDGQVKRYHSALITEVGDVCRSRLPQFVRAEDFDHSQAMLQCAKGDLRMSEQIRDRVTAERDQLQRDKNVTDQRADDLQTLLRNLLKDCMASDFNEHWESFSDAEAYISDLETNKHE